MSAHQLLSTKGNDVRVHHEPEPVPVPEPVANRQAAALRRFWWVVVLVTALAIAGAYVAAAGASTTHTGRASLIVSSNNRAPDQDAVLVQGYVAYFNDAAYQAELLEKSGLSNPVTLTARAAASSPIMLIEATSSSPQTAQLSASAVAETFQADINRVRDRQQQEELRALENRLEEANESGSSESSRTLLQDQIAQAESDRVNRLQELQFQGGVSTNAPNTRINLLFGAFGGLVLGILAALGLGWLDPRRRSLRFRRSS